MSSGTERRVRDNHLTIRLTTEERETIEALADRAGLTVGSFARQTMLEAPAPRQMRRPPIERKELARLLGQLGHVGGNLNQLAKSANTGIAPYAADVERVLTELLDVRSAILVALGREP